MGEQRQLGRVGRYELIELIGRGGMGIVYKARQPGLERTVAVKTILHSQFASPDDGRRFHVEAKAAARLNHPGIVAIHDIGEHNGQPFYSMDYIEGPTLAGLIRNGPLPSREAAWLTQHVAEAMAHAHAHRVLHRDLKPSNILVDGDGQPHITDFGLAKCLADDGDLTSSGHVLGTPNYMSPEQAGGRTGDVGYASDVYSVGAVLYAMLTGRAPFHAATVPEVLRQVSDDLPVSPRRFVAGVDSDLEAICLKCLEKRPGDRYASAKELADDLSRYLRGDPITVRAQGATRIAWHWARRPQRAPQAALIILIIAAFYGVWSAMGLLTVAFDLIPVSRPAEAALIVALDSTGFLLCLAIGLGVLKRRRWIMHGGVIVGLVMLAVIATLIVTGFDAGGILKDPFFRISIYIIFGFVAMVLVAASAVACVSQQPDALEDSIQRRTRSTPASTQSEAKLTTTVAMPKGEGVN